MTTAADHKEWNIGPQNDHKKWNIGPQNDHKMSTRRPQHGQNMGAQKAKRRTTKAKNWITVSQSLSRSAAHSLSRSVAQSLSLSISQSTACKNAGSWFAVSLLLGLCMQKRWSQKSRNPKLGGVGWVREGYVEVVLWSMFHFLWSFCGPMFHSLWSAAVVKFVVGGQI